MTGADEAAIAAHRELVREFARPGGALAPDAPTVTVNNAAWFGPRGPRAARRALHRELLAEHAARFPDARAEKQALVLAGPPGAGKSTVQKQSLGQDESGWVVIDADAFKHALLERAVVDGSYESMIVPEAVRRAQQAGERFAPLVHEESSFLAGQARAAAIDGGLNLVVDTVLSGRRSALNLGAQLEAAGYRVRVVDVETSYEISAARVEQRWRQVTRDFPADPASTGLGGRWVPSEYARALFPSELGGRSVCEGVARELADTCEAVWRHEVFRVSDPAGSPVRESARERARAGGPLFDAAAAQAAREASVGRVPFPGSQQTPGGNRDELGR